MNPFRFIIAIFKGLFLGIASLFRKDENEGVPDELHNLWQMAQNGGWDR